jgi:NAD(P)-dependent dehydrogenase (short-subunit alcohol dehydrogenase family)
MTDQPIARYTDLAGRTVFISGGASGIGADMVTAFHEQGADVVFVDVATADGESLAATLSAKGPEVIFLPCDVTDTSALKAALESAERRAGGIEVLVNNAANDTRVALLDVTEDAWNRAVDINLKHQFFAAQTVCAWMKQRGRGSIINLGSIAPEVMVENLSIYSTCKTAIRGLTRSIARDMGKFGIRANAILPGAILTDRQRDLWYEDQAAIDAVVAEQCINRELCGRDVAEMALFLASDASSACTAQNFIVDGGTV